MVEIWRQIRIFARSESAALAAEIGITAKDPVAAIDAQRRGAIVEHAFEVARAFARQCERTTGEVGPRVQRGRRPTPRWRLCRDRRIRRPRRTDASRETAQVRIATGHEDTARTAEFGVHAEFPRAALD